MNLSSHQTVKELVEHASYPCLSLYMPTFRAGREVRQNRIRFRNLLDASRVKLGRRSSLSAGAREEFLSEMDGLLCDEGFWQHQQSGLAVFCSQDLFVTVQCPVTMPERTLVAERFFVKPLLPLIVDNGVFYVLVLSQNAVGLLYGSRHTIQEVALPEGMPKRIHEITEVYDPEKQLQWHGHKQHRSPQSGEVIFHGHGLGERSEDELLRQFCRKIDASLQRHWAPSQPLLVLACTEKLSAIYKHVSDYAGLVDVSMPGNHEATLPETLHEKAWPIVRRRFANGRREATTRILERSSDSASSCDIEEVVHAAADGRVKSLFVGTDIEIPGRYDVDNRQIQRYGPDQETDGDLVDVAAQLALQTGAEVFACPRPEMPKPAAVNAEFRY